MPRAIRISSSDNVATLLDACTAGQEVVVQGDGPLISIRAIQAIAEGHKIALAAVPDGSPVIKFGTVIGNARTRIEPGDWVHLHNIASRYDERSQTLETTSGAPTDTAYR